MKRGQQKLQGGIRGSKKERKRAGKSFLGFKTSEDKGREGGILSPKKTQGKGPGKVRGRNRSNTNKREGKREFKIERDRKRRIGFKMNSHHRNL